jgi:hypothetical protein
MGAHHVMQQRLVVAVKDPNAVWHLLCITRLGKVSMLRDLTLYEAREAYKRLKPDTHPQKWVDPNCEKCKELAQRQGFYGSSFVSCRSYGPHDDWLDKVEVIGPSGLALDPWYGVEPEIRHIYHCSCPPPPLPWDETRADFWNNPKLWDGIDPTKQVCWQRKPDEHIHSDGVGGGDPKPDQRSPSDLRRSERAKSVAHKSPNPRASDRTKNRPVSPHQSERAGRNGGTAQ